MQNIQIKKYPKRSVESLIDQSVIDNSFNFEAYELRKAFSQNIKKLTFSNNEQIKQIDRLKVQICQLNQENQQHLHKIHELKKQIHLADENKKQMIKINQKINRKMIYLDQKLQTYAQNRAQVEIENIKQQSIEIKSSVLRAEIYQQITSIINKKIKILTQELKEYSMTHQLQMKIQQFLEQLIYLNPHSETQNPFVNFSSREIGKISLKRKNNLYKTGELTNDEQWKRLQKSIQKLKSISKGKSRPRTPKSPLERQNISRSRSLTPNSSVKGRRKIFGQQTLKI